MERTWSINAEEETADKGPADAQDLSAVAKALQMVENSARCVLFRTLQVGWCEL